MLRGYLDLLSVGPGSGLRARLSSPDEPSALGVVHLSHGDPNPAGPGFVTEPCPWTVTPVGPVAEQPATTGSYGVISDAFARCGAHFALLAWVYPTRLDGEPVILSWMTATGSAYLAVTRGHLSLASSVTGIVVEASHEMRERQWCFVGVVMGEQVSLAWGVLGRTGGPYQLVAPGPDSLK